ncbi:MAG: hypothetical protein LUC88_07515, partial [Prevotella sp.]|nr:hypothetical protein [Prevotella sp.]
NTKNLLRLGFLSLFCALGSFAWADDAITLPNTDVVTCTFEGGTQSNTDFTCAGSFGNDSSYGTVTIGETEYDYYLKLDSDGSISFTTKSNCTATLVFGPNDDYLGTKSYFYIETDGTKGDKLYPTTQVYTFECAAGSTYKVEKGSGTYHLFYIGLTGEITTQSEGNEEGGDGNEDDQNQGDGAITLPNTDVVTCTFEGGTQSNTDFTCAGSFGNDSSYGTVTIGETEYDYYLKLDSDGSISFTTKSNCTATLVFGPNDDYLGTKSYFYIETDGTKGDKLYPTTQVYTFECAAGSTYKVEKGSGTYHLFYIGLTGEITTQSEGNEEGGDGNEDDQNQDDEQNQGGQQEPSDVTGYECYWTTDSSDPVQGTEGFYTFNSSCSYKTNHGTATYNGVTYSACIELSSGAEITFTSPKDGMYLTLVFGASDSNHDIKIDGTNVKGSDYVTTLYDEDGETVLSYVLTYKLESAGSHTLAKYDSSYLFYMNLSETTGINGVTLQTTGNNIYYNLAGQRVSSPTKGVYILNGKKILVK